MEELRLAVITGRHPYDVIGFHSAFRSLEGVNTYIQHMDDWNTTPKEIREQYDVVMFYNMHMELPGQDAGWWESQVQASLEQLGDTKQGIFMLHHSILAYPNWPIWSDIIGIENRGFGYHIGETVDYHVADSDHPITSGLTDWQMVDESYTMDEPGDDCHVLITADHPKSMKAIAWTRQHRASRVFCYQSGHDNTAYANPNFRHVLAHGIRWCAGRS